MVGNSLNRANLIRLAGVGMAAAALLAACTDSRTQIRIVGSSTVFPFTTAVAENFSRNNPEYLAPIVEATGTGGGIKLFCDGVGSRFPDVANASRRMKPSELADCQKNGAKDVVEIKVGIDGVVLVQGKKGTTFNLTLRDVYAALAAEPFGRKQTARTWKDVNPALPATRIEVIGPPPTSGTRDAFNELYMVAGCDTDPAMKELQKTDEGRHKEICNKIREDGAYVEAGENDNLIVQNLSTNPNAVGIFGYSYLEENKSRLHGVPIDGIVPTYDSIADGSYPGARPLFIYVKKAHIKPVPGMNDFLAAYAKSWDPGGPLTRRGMIAAPATVRAESAAEIKDQTPMNPAGLH